MASKSNILASVTEIIAVDKLKPYRKNPRVGNIDAIAESLAENGQFRPLIVQKTTNEILGGNHTWKAAKKLGWDKVSVVFVDVDDERAKKIVLADNRTNDLATYDTAILQDIIAGLPDAKGTGYDDEAVASLLKGMQDQNDAMIEEVLRPTSHTSILSPDIDPEDDNSVYGGPVQFDQEDGAVYTGQVTVDNDDVDDLSNELGELQGLLQLKEDIKFGGKNYYGFPDLASTHLLDKLPTPLDTWGGHDATPDDGVTTWLWNYGVASRKNLPMDRAILAFYTYDYHFEGFWENPSFMVAKMLNAGIKTAIVPDFSYYNDDSVAMWVFNHFRAQWVGRYFQEAGIKVIPRIQFGIDKKDSASLDFNTMGIPKNSPVVAKSAQNSGSKEEFNLEVYGMQKSLEKIQPETLLIYGGNPALKMLEALKPKERGLCNEVVHVYNYAHKRRGVVFDKKEGLAGMKKDAKRKVMDIAEAPRGTRTHQQAMELDKSDDTQL